MFIIALVVVGCSAAQVAESADTTAAATTATPVFTPTPAPVATPTASTVPSEEPIGLASGHMATVVADSVVVKREPGRQSEFTTQICFDTGGPCPPLLFGPDTEYESVYLIDGPVEADGYVWYQAATNTANSSYPQYVGWIPVGDEAGPWVVPAETDCPDEPIELSDVTNTAISRLELLVCVGGRELTLRGWQPAPPEAGTTTCQPLDGRESFCTFGYTMLRPIEAAWAGDGNALEWIGETAADLSEPPRNAWVTIRGQFDHPASSGCYEGEAQSVLLCRLDFVVTSISQP